LQAIQLLKLTANSARDKELSVSVSEKAGGVGNNLADVEVIAGVDTVGQDTGLEWAGQATCRDTALIGSSRVRESDARRSCTTLGGFMNVRGCQGHGLVLAGHAAECDVLIYVNR
jgi:hypothetical protein